MENAGKTPLLASALDPRHKHLRFLDENMREAVRKKVFEQYRSISLDVSVTNAAATATSDEDDEAIPTRWKWLSQFFGDDYRESSRDE